jgi:hypothetical protein
VKDRRRRGSFALDCATLAMLAVLAWLIVGGIVYVLDLLEDAL